MRFNNAQYLFQTYFLVLESKMKIQTSTRSAKNSHLFDKKKIIYLYII